VGLEIKMSQPQPSSPLLRGLILIMLAGVFLHAGGARVANLDSWADWKLGQWIWEHKSLPRHEPFSLYSDPQRTVRDTTWLAEVIYFFASARAGLEGVALLHALLETAKSALFVWAVRRATGSLGTALVATLLMEAACWPYFGAIRTTTPAEACWVALLLACAGPIPARAAVLAVPAIFVLWANLGPTFSYGLVLLVGLLVGRFLQEARARRALTAAGRDPGVRRLALMLALAAAAVCLNPYGTTVFGDAFAPDPITVVPARLWPTLVPVQLWENRVVIASVIGVLIVLRVSPRTFTPAEVLLTATFCLWAWYDKRVAPWWLMLAPWLFAPHLLAMAEAARPATGQRARLGSLAMPILACVAAVLLLLSPAARWAMGEPRPMEERAGKMIPYPLITDLKEHTTATLRVFTEPYWWGDYVLWELPPGSQVFWYSRPEGHLARRGGASPSAHPAADEWWALVERYRFNALIVFAEASPGLLAYLDTRPPDEWDIFEDATIGGGRGLVALRRTDPFALSLWQLDAAQACVGGLGLTPNVGQWSVLGQLPWIWPVAAETR
jgi:hypothetical protein